MCCRCELLATHQAARQDSAIGGAKTTRYRTHSSATDVNGQPSPTFVGQPHDPLLALIPDFAFSMPAQVVVEGLNLAMLCVLIFHLAFTGRYHFPLSRKNYILQTSSTLLLLLSVVVELRVILHELDRKSHRYPYMFPYIGVQVPPPDNSWTDVQMVFYLLMKAVTTATAHVSVSPGA